MSLSGVLIDENPLLKALAIEYTHCPSNFSVMVVSFQEIMILGLGNSLPVGKKSYRTNASFSEGIWLLQPVFIMQTKSYLWSKSNPGPASAVSEC